MAHKLLFIFILNLIIISITSKISAFKMKMYPINSPHLQILPKQFNERETNQFLVNLTMSRTLNLETDSSRYDPNTVEISIYRKTNLYVAQLHFGSGDGQVAYTLLDTQSDETWIQCEGCNPCIDLSPDAANFNYKSSPSFQAMTVDDPLCDPKLTYQGACGYKSVYGAATTEGLMGRDTYISIDPNTQAREIYPGLAFGCGLHNKDFDFPTAEPKTNVISGVHGLAPGRRSFLTQLDKQIKGRFTYCLIPQYELGQGQQLLSFGDDAQIAGDGSRIVQTIKMKCDRRYHLNLNGISVDHIRLEIDPSVFQLDPIKYTKGFFIDSGTPFTKLVRKAYDPLRDAIVKYFRQNYNVEPLEPGKNVFDLCYSQYPDEIPGFPKVVFHFEGLDGQIGEVDMPLSKDNMFQKVMEGFCMLIMPNPDGVEYNIFGAFQQTNYKFLYDVRNCKLSFVPQRCETLV